MHQNVTLGLVSFIAQELHLSAETIRETMALDIKSGFAGVSERPYVPRMCYLVGFSGEPFLNLDASIFEVWN